MGKSLNEVAQELKASNKKVQLIYAFNGTGKTRLSRKFKELVESENQEDLEDIGLENKNILYYNAFTEDLFYWDNDLVGDVDQKLKIQPNAFTDWVFNEQGQERNVVRNFQTYTNDKLTPKFNSDFSEITFSYERGNEENIGNIKISKGEESNFIWSVFFSLLNQVIEVRNVPDQTDRETDKFNGIKYIFIDDPVTSLDGNHLIQLAVDLSKLIKKSEFSNGLRFIITTHNPIFYNVLFNEFDMKKGYMLNKKEDGSYTLDDRYGDSNRNFSYHYYLINTLKEAIDNNNIEKYHFTLLRNLYEKTSNFLGYKKWSELLPENKELYAKRVMNFYSHSTLLNEEIHDPTDAEKQTVKKLFDHLMNEFKFWKEG